LKELVFTFKLEGPGWDNVLPSEINRIGGAVITQLLKANTTANAKVTSATGNFAGKNLTIPVHEYAGA
jgi:hypothetical protein